MDFKKLVKKTYKVVIAIVVLAFVAGVLFFYLEQGHQGEHLSLFDCMYWSVVTITTVGYGDFSPVTPMGRLVFIVLGTSGVAMWGFLASVVMSLVVESNLSGVFGLNECKYEDHFVLCGWTATNQVALEELLVNKNKVAVITESKDDVPIINKKGKKLSRKKDVFPVFGDPSKLDVLEQAGIEDARVALLSMEDDSQNLITALHIKDMNPDARIIVRTNRTELKETLQIAGVTFVTTPHELSGRLVASAAFEPDVANFIDDITTATNVGGYDLREFVVPKDRANTVKKMSTLLRRKTNTTLLAIARRDEKSDKWELKPNPSPDVKVRPGDSVILLGNDEQFKRVKEYFQVEKQGR